MPAQGSPAASGGTVKAASLYDEVRFEAGRHIVRIGNLVKVPIMVTEFRQVTSAQFTLAWDPSVLRFASVGDYGLSGLSAGSFGTARTAEGKLAFSWHDSAAAGVTVPDGTAIFAVSFDVIATPGSVSALSLIDSPTLREVSVNLEAAGMATADGEIQVIGADGSALSEAAFKEGIFYLSVPTENGRRYTLEFADTLPATNWQALRAVGGNGQVVILTDPASTNSQRFYRVRIE
jgi:hypothetical protein